MPVRIVVSGATGRMGQTLVRLIRDSQELELAGGIDREPLTGPSAQQHGFEAIENVAGAAELIRGADVVIDFSAPEAVTSLTTERAAELAGKALLVGTTGLDEDAHKKLKQLSASVAVLVAANFSVGVNLMLGMVEAAARVLPPDRFDVEIVETHHRHKADAPSGTALTLGRAIAEARGVQLTDVQRDGRSGKPGARPDGEIGFHALRGGEVVGEHRVLFLGARERFEIAHAAGDRALFADGALIAAHWIKGKPAGWYSMKDVLGL